MSSTAPDADGAIAMLAERVKNAQLPPPAERAQIRRQAGIGARLAAETLNVAPMTLLRWEHGRVTPSLEDSARYREFLNALRLAVQ